MDTASKLDLIRKSMAGELDKPVYEAIQQGSGEMQSPQGDMSSPQMPETPVSPPASPSFSTTIYDNKGEMVTPSTSGVGLNQTMGSKSGSMIQPGQYQDGGKRQTYKEWKEALPENLRDTDTSTYNLEGAFNAGLEPTWNHEDKKYHLNTVDPTSGAFLKSKAHPTTYKETDWFKGNSFDMMNPETPTPQTHKIVTDPKGHFGEDQLQYVRSEDFVGPSEYKTGGKVTKYQHGGKHDPPKKKGAGQGTISRVPGLKGKYLDMMDTPQDFTVKGKPYTTSLREELGRTGAEPTMTMTSAGGFGKGYRLYFPYSDPTGLGFEVDVDPTGPGAGMLIDAQKHLEPMLGTEFPPGYGYVGAEVAGNAVAPFVGLTVGQHDIGKLKDWAKEPGREGWETSFNATEHGMGPFLSMWNQGSRLYEGSHLFPKGIHNPLSGTGEGIGGRMGIKGGNLIPHLETPGGKTIVSVRGGAQNLLNEVADIAKSEKIPFKQALNEEYGKAGFEALKKRKGLPTLLDKAGKAVYGTEGAAGYGKGKTLANWLRNIEIPYGKIIEEGIDLGALSKSKSALGQTLGAVANLPGIKQIGSVLKSPVWNPISAALMAPDAMNLFQEAMHQKGTSPKGFSVMGRTEGDPGDRAYGAFPSIQRSIDESIKGVEKDKQKEIYDKAEKLIKSQFGTKSNNIQGATIGPDTQSEEEGYQSMQQLQNILKEAEQDVTQNKKNKTPKHWGPKYKYGGLRYKEGGLKYTEGGPKKKLKKGTNVKQLQNFLIKKGYDLGEGEGKAITKGVGSFGPKTRAALAAYNKTQNFNTVRAIVSSPTDIIPTNFKEFFKSTVLPGWAYNMLGDLDEENLTLRQRSKLTQTVDEALKENKSQLGYKDNPNMKAYDEFGYSDMGNTSKFFDVVKKSLTSPAYNLKTTIGRANIIETPEYYDDEGNVVPSQRFVSDEYDFNDSKEAEDRTFTEKWKDILGAGSFQAGMRAIGRNYGNTQPKNTMIRVQKEGGLRKKKK